MKWTSDGQTSLVQYPMVPAKRPVPTKSCIFAPPGKTSQPIKDDHRRSTISYSTKRNNPASSPPRKPPQPMKDGHRQSTTSYKIPASSPAGESPQPIKVIFRSANHNSGVFYQLGTMRRSALKR